MSLENSGKVRWDRTSAVRFHVLQHFAVVFRAGLDVCGRLHAECARRCSQIALKVGAPKPIHSAPNLIADIATDNGNSGPVVAVEESLTSLC